MAYKVNFSTPEAQPTITGCRIAQAAISFDASTVSATIVDIDGGGNALDAANIDFTLSGADLQSIAVILLAAAQAAGKIPAGNIV